jgi:hypothetical protein
MKNKKMCKEEKTRHIVKAVLFLFVVNLLVTPLSAFADGATVGISLLERPVSVTIIPDSPNINIGGLRQFTAMANFTENPSIDVTNSSFTTWSSEDTSVATVTNGSTKGLAVGVGSGTTTIHASYGPPDGMVDGSTLINVDVSQTVNSVTISPTSFNLHLGDTLQVHATAHFSCSPAPCIPAPDTDITASPTTTWFSDDINVATVNNGTSKGLVAPVNYGSTHINATYHSVIGQAIVGVSGGGGGNSVTPVTPVTLPPLSPVVTQETQVQTQQTQTQTQETQVQTQQTQAQTQQTQVQTQQTQVQTQQTQTQETIPPEPIFSPTPNELPPAAPPEMPAPPPPGAEEFAPTIGVVTPDGSSVTETPFEQTPLTSGTQQPLTPGEQAVASSTQEATVTPTERINPDLLPPELKVSRGEILTGVMQEFDIEQNNKDLLQACSNNLEGCLSIFRSVSTYDGIRLASNDIFQTLGNTKKVARVLGFNTSVANAANLLELGNMQLFPDVPPELPSAYAINIATMLGFVQGYYEDTGSPFKPDQAISRIEAIKVLLGVTELQKWLYYDELEASLGGVEAVKAQQTPFADIKPTRDAMWWYPAYLNKACETGMIDCTPGTNFKPDDWITDAELSGMMVKLRQYLKDSNFTTDENADPDGDTLKTYLEKTVYFTNPANPDTDLDKLRDDEEVLKYKTSPFVADTDGDGLSDYTEVKELHTDPLKIDTDGDTFGDGLEVSAGSDPNDANSIPAGAEKEGVSDAWEQKYKIEVQDGMQDSDGDGLSDKLEYQYNTDPLNPDTDGDGFSDAEEVLQLKTDPNVKNDVNTMSEIGVKITNFVEYQPVSDNTPLIKGIAPVGSIVRIVLRNDFGHEKILGDATVDENYSFIFQVTDPIRDGSYMFVAKSLNPKEKKITVSDPVHVIIDSTRNVSTPVPLEIGDQKISEDVLLKNLRIEIQDRQPVLMGQTEYGNRVEATWRSIVTTSALIADASTGEFAIKAPRDLELGQHEVYITATRSKDMAQSATVKILFNVGLSFPGEVTTLKPSAEAQVKPLELGVVFGSVQEFAQKNTFLFWIVIALVLMAGGAVIYLAMISRKRK